MDVCVGVLIICQICCYRNLVIILVVINMLLPLIFALCTFSFHAQLVAQYLVYCAGGMGVLGTNMIGVVMEYSNSGSTIDCYCPYGTYDAGQRRCYLSSAITGCIRGTGTTDTDLVCNFCGYGLTLTSNITCVCTNYNITGGCSTDAACDRIVYSAFNQSACVSCKPTFTLLNGVCSCQAGESFNSTANTCYTVNTSSTPTAITTTNITGCITALNVTYCSICGYSLSEVNGSCVCLGQNVTGGCTSIPACTYIAHTTPTTATCVSCASTFTLLSTGMCVCVAGTFFNSSSNQCQSTTATTITTTVNANPSTPAANNDSWLSPNQIMVVVTVVSLVVLAIAAGLIYLLYKSCNSFSKVDGQRVYTEADLKNASSIDIKTLNDNSFDPELQPKRQRQTKPRRARKTVDEIEDRYQMDEVHAEQNMIDK